MYCSDCKLRVGDESIKICPVCQGHLQPEVDKELEPDPGLELKGEFAAGPKSEPGLDFDPEALGLKSAEQKESEDGINDMRILADLWEKEDIAADLDEVLAEAFTVETVDLIAEEPVESKKNDFVPLNSRPFADKSSSRRNFWLPLLILAGLVVLLAGGWIYMRDIGSKPEAGISDTSKPTDASASKLDAETDKPVVTEKAVDEKAEDESMVQTSESEAVKSESLPASATTSDEGLNLNSEKTTAAVAEVVAQLPDEPVKKSVEAAANQTVVEALATKADPPVESSLETQILQKSEAAAMIPAPAVSAPVPAPVPAPDKRSVEPVPEKAVLEIGKPTASSSAAVATITGSRYVVQVGSFRSFDGATKQLAKLHKKGFAAYSVQADLGEKGVWQRIFIPGGASPSDAKLVQEKLAELLPQEKSLIRKLKK